MYFSACIGTGEAKRVDIVQIVYRYVMHVAAINRYFNHSVLVIIIATPYTILVLSPQHKNRET